MRSLNLDQLRAFIEVIERGSITAAAKQLNLSQPAVTHQVQELERRFGVPLTERIGKRMYLTQAGEKLSSTPAICSTRMPVPSRRCGGSAMAGLSASASAPARPY